MSIHIYTQFDTELVVMGARRANTLMHLFNYMDPQLPNSSRMPAGMDIPSTDEIYYYIFGIYFYEYWVEKSFMYICCIYEDKLPNKSSLYICKDSTECSSLSLLKSHTSG
jgi:hypothetical protein